MTEDYTPPTISNELGRSAEAAIDRNFISRGISLQPLSDIDGVAIPSLINKFGSPLFVFSEHSLRSQARHALQAFRSRYQDTHFGWSYKTNYLSAICQILHSEGWDAEVVSDFEYQKAKKLGISGSDIIYNGPYKPEASLKTALEEGALVQIDNWDELSLIEQLTSQQEKTVRVGIRIWLDAGIRPVWSKFGFSLSNGEAARAAIHVINNPKLQLESLHTHIGTYILEPNAYRVATQKLVALREQLELQQNYLVPCLNLGGGVPSQSLLHGMMGPAKQVVPPIESYAEAITGVLAGLPANKQPMLRLELGRYLVDEAGYLLTSVTALKGSSRPAPIETDQTGQSAKEWLILQEEARRSLVIDAGINLLYTAAWFQIDALPTRVINTPLEPTRLYGPLCMAIDSVREQVDLPQLEVGDTLALHPVGAYNLGQSMQFIEFRPAAILICEDGTPEVIRRRECLEDVDGPERLPPHLEK